MAALIVADQRRAMRRGTDMTGQTTMSAAFRRDINALEDVLALVETFASTAALQDRRRSELAFVVDELFTNCVRHNAAGASEIEIALALRGPDIVVEVTDRDAAAFDPNSDAPRIDANAPLEQRESSGLGLYLLKKLADRVEYHHRDRVATVILTKRME